MVKVNDGGPVFPVIETEYDTGKNEYIGNVFSTGGMSLLDFFAANEKLADVDHPESTLPRGCCDALAGYSMPNKNTMEYNEYWIEYFKWEAAWRSALKYIRANAMLKAREANNG